MAHVNGGDKAYPDPGDYPGPEVQGLDRFGVSETINWSAIMHRIQNGQEDLSEWTLEELERCQKRFGGTWIPKNPPRIIPRQILDELRRRMYTQAEGRLRAYVLPAIDVVGQHATGQLDGVTSTQLKAALEVMDRYLGKPKERVEVNVGVTAWEEDVRVAVQWEASVSRRGNGEAGSAQAALRGQVEEEGTDLPPASGNGTSSDDDVWEAEVVGEADEDWEP